MEKKRCNNFTSNEIDVLVSLVEEFKDTVECKKTDTVTNNIKDLEWRKIESRFNAVCATARTAKMLRSKWESLKKSTKKQFAEHKQSLYKTGGGPGFPGPGFGAIIGRILAILGIGATGTCSQFDSDIGNGLDNFNSEIMSTDEPDELTITDEPDATILTIIDAEIMEQDVTTDKASLEDSIIISSSSNWKTWNPQQLRQPKSKALEFSEQNVDVCFEEDSEAQEKLSAYKKTPHCSSSVKKRKKLYKVEPVSSKIKNKQKCPDQLLHKELVMKKMALIELQTEILTEERDQKKSFIDLQMKILREEAEQKKKHLEEKHDLEIKLLLANLKNKEDLLG